MSGSLGLDFGTSTTFLALSDRAGRTSMVDLGSAGGSADAFLPSVAMPRAGGYLVGEEADNRAAGVLRSVKRCVTRNQTSTATTGADPIHAEADQVIAAIFDEAVHRAEQIHPRIFCNRPIRLGCPAMWDGPQRRRLAGIASRQGLNVTVQEIVDEPIAAGVGWVTEQRARGQHVEGRVLVVDIGGGTLDVAFLDVVDDGKLPTFTVLSADAMDRAGDDVDAAIASELRAGLQERGKDPSAGPDPDLAEALLSQAARTLKVRLSNAVDASVGVPPLLGVAELSYSRAALEQRLQPLLADARNLVRSVLASGRMRERNAPNIQQIIRDLDSVTNDVRYVLLTGGTSQIPCVRDFFTAMFPSAKVDWSQSSDAQQAVALGLAGTENYSRLNLHRPPFDLVALNPDGSEQILYAAYTPLYETWQMQSGMNMPGHVTELRNDSGTARNVRVICRDLGGRQVPIVTVERNGKDTHSTALDLRIPSGGGGRVKLYVDGKLLLSAPGHHTTYRMESWPVLRSDDRGVPASVRFVREDGYGEGGATTGETPGEPG